ncbi:hypothetical protein SAMN05216251_103225 [Actinacidiphila alni]|uniref:Uncharacterized protein n=2 Tax=Actinacidiphila alni TaxID=380248 RepID=A0A1I2ATM9_9ACTN|nr:hypothetical protein SAMN05216251_103225 [Actinacidiphila alni]
MLTPGHYDTVFVASFCTARWGLHNALTVALAVLAAAVVVALAVLPLREERSA